MPEENDNIFSKTVRAVAKGGEKLKESIQGASRSMTGVTGLMGQMARNLVDVISPFAKVQSAAAQLAKSVGLAGKNITNSSIKFVKQNSEMELSRAYGISNEEIWNLQKVAMSSIGRNAQIDITGPDSTLENLIGAHQIFGPETVAKMTAGYDKLGLSMKTAAKASGKLFAEASQYGINAQKYAENFTSNLEMAQRYNFRNGINGLKEMARKATEIRQDMRQIANFADKVGSVGSAVETAANLQVLGGSFAAIANPLTMLNKSLTDINGLQDMAINATEGAASYNSTTHQIEMDPVTRQIMKRAAESIGMDPGALIDQAYAQARRGEVSKQMEGMGGFNTEVKKMLPNIAEIDSETGAAGATIGGEFYTLSQISENQELQKQLVEETRSESEDVKAIAKSVMTTEDLLKGLLGQLENENALNAIKPGIISGKTNLDLAQEGLTQIFSKEAITGAANLDQSLATIAQNWNMFVGAGLTELIKPFSSTNAEEFGTKMGDAFSNILGESVRKLGESLGTSVATTVENVAKKLKEYGVTPLGAFEKGSQKGTEGKSATIEKPEDTQNPEPPVASPTKDGTQQAESFSTNGRQNMKMPPLENVNALNHARAEVLGENGIGDNFFKDLMGAAGNNATLPIAPTLFNGQTTTEIKGTNTSIPPASVTPTENKAQTTTGQQTGTGQNKGNESQTLKITGTLTMNVNGDNGKVGVVDLINNPDFMRELAKAIADAYAKMGNSGLVFNK